MIWRQVPRKKPHEMGGGRRRDGEGRGGAELVFFSRLMIICASAGARSDRFGWYCFTDDRIILIGFYMMVTVYCHENYLLPSSEASRSA